LTEYFDVESSGKTSFRQGGVLKTGNASIKQKSLFQIKARKRSAGASYYHSVRPEQCIFIRKYFYFAATILVADCFILESCS
jgi:hypothetical protein